MRGWPCDIKLAGIHFTKAVNGADTLAKTDTQGRIDFRLSAKKDFFCDPNDNKLSNNTAPILLAKVDNTKPFTLVAKLSGILQAVVRRSQHVKDGVVAI